MKSVVVAAVQMKSELGDIERNAAAMRFWIARAAEAGAAFVFFPEGSLSGYTMGDPGEAAIEADDARVLALESYASDLGIAVGYGFAECVESQERPYLSYVVASGDGRLAYRKTHLGSREREFYAAGDALPVAWLGGVNLGVQLCWEAHIPDIASTLRAQGAELIVSPHAGGLHGTRRIEAWNRYLPARALDNGLFVVACNALAVSPRGAEASRGEASDFSGGGTPEGDGGLAVYGPDGRALCTYCGAEEHMVVAQLCGPLPREVLQKGMTAISYYECRRPELYQ